MASYVVTISQAGEIVLNEITVSIQNRHEGAWLKSWTGEFLAPSEINFEPWSQYRMTLADGRYCDFTVLNTIIRSDVSTLVRIRPHSEWLNPHASASAP